MEVLCRKFRRKAEEFGAIFHGERSELREKFGLARCFRLTARTRNAEFGEGGGNQSQYRGSYVLEVCNLYSSDRISHLELCNIYNCGAASVEAEQFLTKESNKANIGGQVALKLVERSAVIEQLKKELERLAGQGRQRQFHIVHSRTPGFIELAGKRFVDFTNWDVLNLASSTRVKRTLQEETERFGGCASSNRLASGTFQPHVSAENRIARFLGTEAALLFSSRTQALLSLVTALCTERDLICFEELCQAPVSDAAYLTNTTALAFTMADLSSLEEPLAKARDGARRFIFVEAFSPVSGRRIELAALGELARHHDARVILDSSCCLGLVGTRGAGVLEGATVDCLPYAQLGDLATGLGGFGAFLASDRVTISYLVQKSRNLRIEPPLPPALASGIEAAIDHAELQAVQRSGTLRHAERVRSALRSMQATVFDSSSCPFVCLQLANMRTAFELQEFLISRSIFSECVPRGTLFDQGAVLRFIFNAEHTEKQIDDLISVLAESVPKTFSH